jgi:hypothetical protein
MSDNKYDAYYRRKLFGTLLRLGIIDQETWMSQFPKSGLRRLGPHK